MIQFNKDLLVPVDFRQPSVNAIQLALKLAPFIKGNIRLLHVLDTGNFFTELLDIKIDMQQSISTITKKLDKLKAQFTGSGNTEIVTKIETGKPFRKILEYAGSVDPALILIGDNDHRIGQEKIMGTINTQIITHARWPVITVRQDVPPSLKKIVLPVDLSLESRSQLCNAIALARHYQSTIYLVSVVIGGIKVRDSRIYKIMRQVQDAFVKNGVRCEIKLYSRSDVPVYQRILEYSNEVEADMVMIMTHKEGTTSDNYIGAVAHHVINMATIPILSLTHSAAVLESEVVTSFLDPMNILTGEKKQKRQKRALLRFFGKS